MTIIIVVDTSEGFCLRVSNDDRFYDNTSVCNDVYAWPFHFEYTLVVSTDTDLAESFKETMFSSWFSPIFFKQCLNLENSVFASRIFRCLFGEKKC